ncbi:MAG: hypothetical protein ABIQ95_09205 [Bdellovibrionia bacterium]
MKKNRKSVLFNLSIAIAIQLFSLHTGFARDRNIIHGGGGGHDVPTPFQLTQTKFELADGELYSLVGTIVFAPPPVALVYQSELQRPSYTQFYGTNPKKLHPYFSIDLENHPWIANAKRVDSPLYYIEGTSNNWKKWEGTSVNLLCRANGRILLTSNGPEYAIQLEPIDAEPFSIVYQESFPGTNH